jgi:transcriptional regulator with PAS, ATPase and Fis domain
MSDPKHAATPAHGAGPASAHPVCCAPVAGRPAPGLDALLEALPFPAYTIDATDHVVSMNSAAKALVGAGTGSVAGQICHDVFHCQMCAVTCAAQDARKTGEIQREFPVDLHPSGAPGKRVRIDAAPLENGLVAVMIRDVKDVSDDARPPEPDLERVKDALARTAGNVTLAAALLDVHRTTLWRWMTEKGLHRKEFRPGKT